MYGSIKDVEFLDYLSGLCSKEGLSFMKLVSSWQLRGGKENMTKEQQINVFLVSVGLCYRKAVCMLYLPQ
jgi:hypothetical protein